MPCPSDPHLIDLEVVEAVALVAEVEEVLHLEVT
jgi:hypothetical protein